MNHQDSRNVTTKTFSPTALTLVLGLALAFPGTAALATDNPIPGVDIIVKKNPGGIAVVVPIDDSGKFSLRLKEPGNHTISTVCRQPGGCLPHKLSGTLKPGAEGEPSIIAILIGLLLPAQKASVGGTSYTFTVGDRGVVLSGQIPSAASVRVAAGDVNGDGVEARKAGEPIKGVGPRPPPIVVPGTLAFTSANVDANTPVNGIGGTGGGRFTFKPTSPVADPANAASSNRDHIDQDAQTDIRKKTAVQPGGPGNARIRISADVATIRVTETALGTDGGDGKLPGILRVINNSEKDEATVEAINGIGGTGGGRFTFKPTSPVTDPANAASSNRDHIDQDAQTDIRKKTAVHSGGPGDVNGDGVESRKAGEPIKGGGPRPPPIVVPGTLAFTSANVDGSTPVNGIGGLGGGRFTFKPTSPVADSANVETSNRDHIDQDAQTDIRKKTAVQPGGPGDARVRVSADVSTIRVQNYGIRVTETAPGTADRDGKLPGKKAAPKPTSPGTGPHRSLTAGEPVPGVESTDVSRTRGTALRPEGGNLPTYSTAPPHNDGTLPSKKVGDPIPGIPVGLEGDDDMRTAPGGGGDGKLPLPGLAGDPIPGVEVGLEGDPEKVRVSTTKTNNQGAFHFDKLPAGNYKLTLPDLPSQPLTVGADGIAGGTVMRGPSGSVSIFDRWGKSFTAPPPKAGNAKQDTPDQTAGSKAAGSPVGFGSGNHAMGIGPGTGLGAGPGMSHPGAAMGGTSPMSPGAGPMNPMGAGPMGGGPGGAMRP